MKYYIKPIQINTLINNSYLIKTAMGFILINTGKHINHKQLVKELNNHGCSTNNLILILVLKDTIFDYKSYHFLRMKYNTKIATHIISYQLINETRGEVKKLLRIFQKGMKKLFGIPEFIPDFRIDEGYSLKEFGLNARIINLSNITKSRIGILTDEGILFCDELNLADSKQLSRMQMLRLKKFLVNIIYTGQENSIPLFNFEV